MLDKLSDKYMKFMKLNENLRLKIINDAKFSLELAYKISLKADEPLKQATLERQAERESNILLLPVYIDTYKEMGFSEEEIFQTQEQPAK